jgi:hypothetical protein
MRGETDFWEGSMDGARADAIFAEGTGDSRMGGGRKWGGTAEKEGTGFGRGRIWGVDVRGVVGVEHMFVRLKKMA